MKTMRFQSDKVVQYFRDSFKDRAGEVMVESALLDLVRRKHLSPRAAADLLSMHLTDFVDLMSERGIPYFTEQPQDINALVRRHQEKHEE